MSNSQIGTGLVINGAPKFADFVVVKDTWKEKDSTEKERTDDGDGAVYNYSFWKPGVDASCDWVVKTGQTPAAIGDVVAESSPGTRSFIVLDATTSRMGGKPLRQSVQLAYHDGFTPTVIS